MVTAGDVIRAVQGKICNMVLVEFEARQIDACDEENVTPVGKPFIKKYHHFSYGGAGVVNCRYVKGVGDFVRHTMVQGAGTALDSFIHPSSASIH